jgi:asparagine synthase (glutamine-hydrolysing)
LCGITGFLSFKFDSNYSYVSENMASALVSRGPDDSGSWACEVEGVALAHRRLSVLDLSTAGHQPMTSPSKRYVLSFNGEIYNHLELRNEVSKLKSNLHWVGQSDSETLSVCFDVFGVQRTIEKCVGMFAIAVWDKVSRSLSLVRDRLGEKPLYYGWQGNSFLFGSELKALKLHPDFQNTINRGAISLLLRHNCIPAPYSIYEGICKLEPGSILTVTNDQTQEFHIEKYWTIEEAAKAGQSRKFDSDDVSIVNRLETVLTDAVEQQMLSDVPLGAFLSGGIDSSLISALMQRLSSEPVKTFTIGFESAGYNEAVHAKEVAKHIRSDHTELYVTPMESLEVIANLPKVYCEPFADSSQIPTFLVSKLAKSEVTVALSGDAGDELFGGYNRYVIANQAWKNISMFPKSVRKGIAKGLLSRSPDFWDKSARFIPGASKYVGFGNKIHKGAAVLESDNIMELYSGLVSHFDDPSRYVIGGEEPNTLVRGNIPQLDFLAPVEMMMALDQLTYLPDDILTKVDRAAMSVSLETRVPFLDHRVVEFAWRLPLNAKIRDGQSKWALRQVLYRYVPKELIDRPKMGFGIPIHDWLRGPLKDWAEQLLDENRLIKEGFFHVKPIRSLWEEHLSGCVNYGHKLWPILMFQAWLEQQ